MKKLLLLSVFLISVYPVLSQPTGLVNETFNLKYLIVDDVYYYTPNGENPTFAVIDYSVEYGFEAGGIFNMAFGSIAFNDNSFTLDGIGITLHDCQEPNCYYENLYYYGVLTTSNMETKTFTYNYNEGNGIKYFRFMDSNGNVAVFSDGPNQSANPLLFQTWYLYKREVDMGDPVYYEGADAPEITINPDMTYTGKDGCAVITGELIYSEINDYWDFTLQSRNYSADESNCPDGTPVYAMPELGWDIPLGSMVYRGNDGMDYFEYESYAGFISYFRNQRLSTSKNELLHVNVFPNPAKDMLFIESKDAAINTILITDLNGRTVIASEGDGINEIDISALSSGMYFLRMESSMGNMTKKFIKN